MKDEDYRRWVRLNLPHARTVTQRIGQPPEALEAFGQSGNGDASALSSAFHALARRLRGYDEDPPAEEALPAADEAAALARLLVEAILGTFARGDRLGQNVRNLFECLGLPDEGARLALRCGEKEDSPLR